MRTLLLTTAALFAISCGSALAAAGGGSAGAGDAGAGGAGGSAGGSSGNSGSNGGGNGHTAPAVQSTMPNAITPSYGVTTNTPTSSGSLNNGTSQTAVGRNPASGASSSSP